LEKVGEGSRKFEKVATLALVLAPALALALIL